MIDEPIQYFFATSFTTDVYTKVSNDEINSSSSIQSYLDSFDSLGELKVHLFPEET